MSVSKIERKVFYQDLKGIDYQEAWDYQTSLHKSIVEKKRSDYYDRFPESARLHYLLLCHHPNVYTLGKSGSADNLLADSTKLEEMDARYYKINRGGDITYHGPGQLVVYPLLDLDGFFTDVHRYVRSLEECVIRLLKKYGLEAIRSEGFTGVWLPGGENKKSRKICAIGVHLSRWVTMHGLALNVNTDLSYFSHIVPCGIADESKTVTSMAKELGKTLDEEQIKRDFRAVFEEVFECKTIST